MSSNITISIAKKESDKERCGYCFAGLFDEETWVCDACETTLHSECHDELQSCVTMGCKNKTHSSDELPAHIPTARRRRIRRARRTEPLSPQSRFLTTLGLIILGLSLVILIPITLTVVIMGLIMFAVAAFTGEIGLLIGIVLGFGFSSVLLVLLCTTLMKVFGNLMSELRNEQPR